MAVGVEETRFCAAAVVPIPWWFVLSAGRGGRGGGGKIAFVPRTESMMLRGRAGRAGGCSPVACGVSASLVAPFILLVATEGCKGGGSNGSGAV